VYNLPSFEEVNISSYRTPQSVHLDMVKFDGLCIAIEVI